MPYRLPECDLLLTKPMKCTRATTPATTTLAGRGSSQRPFRVVLTAGTARPRSCCAPGSLEHCGEAIQPRNSLGTGLRIVTVSRGLAQPIDRAPPRRTTSRGQFNVYYSSISLLYVSAESPKLVLREDSVEPTKAAKQYLEVWLLPNGA